MYASNMQASLEDVLAVGVEYEKLELSTFEERLASFCKLRDYKCQDEVSTLLHLMY